MIDTDEDDLSKSDERVSRVLKHANEEKAKDIHDQKVHAFVLTYTNLFNEKYIKNVVEALADSIKLK